MRKFHDTHSQNIPGHFLFAFSEVFRSGLNPTKVVESIRLNQLLIRINCSFMPNLVDELKKCLN